MSSKSKAPLFPSLPKRLDVRPEAFQMTAEQQIRSEALEQATRIACRRRSEKSQALYNAEAVADEAVQIADYFAEYISTGRA